MLITRNLIKIDFRWFLIAWGPWGCLGGPMGLGDPGVPGPLPWLLFVGPQGSQGSFSNNFGYVIFLRVFCCFDQKQVVCQKPEISWGHSEIARLKKNKWKSLAFMELNDISFPILDFLFYFWAFDLWGPQNISWAPFMAALCWFFSIFVFLLIFTWYAWDFS